jgi:hypothetical protein
MPIAIAMYPARGTAVPAAEDHPISAMMIAQTNRPNKTAMMA